MFSVAGQKFKKKFGQKEHSAANPQEEDESVHQLVLDVYTGVDAHNIQLLAVDDFFRGCSNTFAALTAASRRCYTLHRTVKWTKECIHDQKAIGKPTFGETC